MLRTFPFDGRLLLATPVVFADNHAQRRVVDFGARMWREPLRPPHGADRVSQ